MKVAIAGGTGFIGRAFINELLKNDHQVIILTRSLENKKETKNIRYVKWLSSHSEPEKELQDVDAFVNLAGESLNSGRWTDERKRQIIESRVSSTRETIRIMGELLRKPSVFMNASAIGCYPVSYEETFTESSNTTSESFLSKTVDVWEAEAHQAERLGIRTVMTRFGVILGKEEGALPRMALPYKLFVGGRIGSGKQWMSWIHVHDVARALLFIMEHPQMNGPVNLTAPSPERLDTLGKTLADVLHRPHWLPVPAFAIKLTLGEMSTLVLDGQRVLPEKLTAHSFTFQFPHLKEALEDIYK
ncbi:multidrug MFS transporter [Bacillus sp. FJAT-27231]|uniref:TIGR01777 family oxidoreductase n=1 Tax=Bacillus sp. FJAT-27231 TaxID=1679168 RepID=UPI000670D181|nr:TIGR01777 family oxidoreductase [Bacillus sp. FJAT-27231]KMY53096.1 multidrug MFS transporter [Bacillus sp. FJAT-27231]